jgi:hypothetical protein
MRINYDDQQRALSLSLSIGIGRFLRCSMIDTPSNKQDMNDALVVYIHQIITKWGGQGRENKDIDKYMNVMRYRAMGHSQGKPYVWRQTLARMMTDAPETT